MLELSVVLKHTNGDQEVLICSCLATVLLSIVDHTTSESENIFVDHEHRQKTRDSELGNTTLV